MLGALGLGGLGVGVGGLALSGLAAAGRTPLRSFTRDAVRPRTDWGLQIGDVEHSRALVWSRCGSDARMLVEWSRHESFRDAVRLTGPVASAETDLTARLDLTGLPAGEQIFVRVQFEDLSSSKVRSEPLLARFRTPALGADQVRFVWSGDTGGQGYGIDLEFGGMRIYETMRGLNPDFFIHSGDNIYADGPMLPEVVDVKGHVVWRNAFLDVVPEKLRVAQTLHEYRRAYLYNRYDPALRAFSAEVPQIWQWDDHEVSNNWYPARPLNKRQYPDASMQTLIRNGSRAFSEYSPVRFADGEIPGVYRVQRHGTCLDVFVLDMRSYRAPNGCNLETHPGAATAFLGAAQKHWLKTELQRSQATWKVIAADMPLGVRVADGSDPSGCGARWENLANQDGPVRGREFELAEILSFIKREAIQNVVWLTADVHYCAAHYYDPASAQFQDFAPFWEFVAGPMNAGSNWPGVLDNTFGPRVVFQRGAKPGQWGLPPSAGLQFFGQVDIDRASHRMTVRLKDLDGRELFSQDLEPARRRTG